MKEGVVLLFGLLVLFSFPFVFAQEEGVDDDTLVEAAAISDSNHGAVMRMLQLARAIERRVVWGNEIISVLSENGEDITRLEEIIDELEFLADEAASADTSDLNLAVEKFLAIKADAKSLIGEFREIASGLLTEEEKSQLRARWGEIDRTEVQQYNERIRNARREVNAQRVSNMLQAMGEDDAELVRNIRNGAVTASQVRARVVEHYSNAVAERAEVRQQFRTNVQAAVSERVNARQAAVTDYVRNRASSMIARAQERRTRLANAE